MSGDAPASEEAFRALLATDSTPVKGKWPTARDHWGSWKKKLECVFVVRIPSEENRDPRRMVPGRDDVYILPKTDCVPDENGEYFFYPNENIVACLILKPPDDRAGCDTLTQHAASPTAERVQLSSTRDGNGGMQQVTLGANLAAGAAAADYETIDESSGFPPKVLSCVATVALSPSPPDPSRCTVVSRRRRQVGSCGLRDVARFSDEEMEAALYALDQELPQPYSLAFFFTSKATAQGICEAGGGIRASHGRFGDAIVVCSKSPVSLGWEKNGGGSFRPNVGRLLWGASPVTVQAGGRYAAELEVMVVLGVPTAMLRDSRNEYQPPDLWSIPAEYRTAAGLYSNAHVLKCYELGGEDEVVKFSNPLS